MANKRPNKQQTLYQYVYPALHENHYIPKCSLLWLLLVAGFNRRSSIAAILPERAIRCFQKFLMRPI